MAADIVNLRQARKQKARADKAQHAAEQRATFGQTKAAKTQQAAERQQAAKALDNHKRCDRDPS